MALTAARSISQATDQVREYPVASGKTIYRGGFVGLTPHGYLKPFEPGDVLAGLAHDSSDNSAGGDGGKNCKVVTAADLSLSLSSANYAFVGRDVYATADDAVSTSGHYDGFVGRVIQRANAAGQAVVRMQVGIGHPIPGVDIGSVLIAPDLTAYNEATGAASTTKYWEGGVFASSVLGLGVYPFSAAASGTIGAVAFEFDAVAEVAAATMSGLPALSVARGISAEFELHMTNAGDNAALDVDWGIGTLLTANSIADIDHADMVNLCAFHMDGNSQNINLQSDNNVTDVANTDTTIDNSTTAGDFYKYKIIARTTGVCEAWIDVGAGYVRALSTTAFAVGSTAVLVPFINVEKTADDTLAVLRLRKFRAASGRV